MGLNNTSGDVTLTASAVLITSGSPVRVYSCSWVSGASAGVIQLYNGTDNSGTARISETGTALKSKTANFQNGLLFSSGCYVELDGNISACTLECSKEL